MSRRGAESGVSRRPFGPRRSDLRTHGGYMTELDAVYPPAPLFYLSYARPRSGAGTGREADRAHRLLTHERSACAPGARLHLLRARGFGSRRSVGAGTSGRGHPGMAGHRQPVARRGLAYENTASDHRRRPGLHRLFFGPGLARDKTYQNEELLLAIEQLRLRRPDVPWLIPVRFDDCPIPERDLGGGRTLGSIQSVDLFGERIAEGTTRLVAAVLRILAGNPSPETGHRTGGRGVAEVSITSPDATDAGLRSVQSVVYVQVSEPIGDLTACYVTDQANGGQPRWGTRHFISPPASGASGASFS